MSSPELKEEAALSLSSVGDAEADVRPEPASADVVAAVLPRDHKKKGNMVSAHVTCGSPTEGA